MGEMIDKQEAIDVILGQPPELHYPSWYAGQIRSMPPAQPKRIKSKWMISSDGYYPYCSVCKREPKGGNMTAFCPNCGSYMLGEEDGGPQFDG